MIHTESMIVSEGARFAGCFYINTNELLNLFYASNRHRICRNMDYMCGYDSCWDGSCSPSWSGFRASDLCHPKRRIPSGN